ncbi:hypothetical protein IT072_02380 [Leifsonia sp. ZF2019]|uniref:hypothetical protein n=1 Tax=Leifsonia sp. ZF2019 TaxID=2781978 RepID=UPI001CC145FB|nr:hypothetical protein [Leifsonia sp. ZF2019]UAJ78314.1 hypothetical protein IT072_13705 [Leifsonia sp. ZF2019]UAJ79944.1 hypothetical protein IT072_02380 [Leifsonia sp. ZF2019]
MSNVAGVIFTDLPAVTISKLQSLLDSRAEPFTEGVSVSNKAIEGETRMVTVNLGTGTGTFNTLDDATLRINVRALDEGDAADLALMVRAIFEAPAPLGIRDGDPITACRVSAGPVEVPNDTKFFQWYMVANVTRRGIQFT